MFRLCEKWMSRQDFQGSVQWIVVDDGHAPTDCTMGQEYVRVERPDRPVVTRTNHTVGDNLARALPLVRAPKVLVIEDDDYYGKHYVRTMSELLDQHELVGESGSKYYRLDNSTYEHFASQPFRTMAALARTGWRSQLNKAVQACCPGDAQVDRRIWDLDIGNKFLLEPSVSGLHISVKCGPGRRSHNYGRALPNRDIAGVRLLEWTKGDYEAVSDYLDIQGRTGIVVYSAVTGRDGKPYSAIKPPVIRAVEHTCFTDLANDLPGWTTRRDGLDASLDAGIQSRKWKCLPHEFFTLATHSIYVDASMQLLIHPLDLISKMETRWPDADVAVVRHPFQSDSNSWTVKSELDWVLQKKYAPSDLIASQLECYREAGWLGLPVSQCGLIVRKHNAATEKLGKEWWSQIVKHGHRRDQPSFPVAAALSGVVVREWTHHERSAHFTRWIGHSEKERPKFQ